MRVICDRRAPKSRRVQTPVQTSSWACVWPVWSRPLRRPQTQLRTAHHPRHSQTHTPRHDRLHRTPTRRRQDTTRGKPLPQALPRPQPLPATRAPVPVTDLTDTEASLAQTGGPNQSGLVTSNTGVGVDGISDNCHSLAVTARVQSTVDEYIHRYSERDVEGVTDLCLWPFLAVRKGAAIHLPDRAAVRDHFAGAIVAYRVIGVVAWTQVEIYARQLGESSVFATVHWNALGAGGEVLRDTWTSYQLLDARDGWRFLSYTNHF